MKTTKLLSVILFLFTITLFYNCSTDDSINDDVIIGTDGTPIEDEDETGGDETGGDETGGDETGGDPDTVFPYDVLALNEWKITMPLDGIDSDDRADEVYCDPNRNDNPEHPSFKEYTDERFFYVNNSCVVFSSPVEAGTPTTSNSNNTRTELREMPADCSGEAGWDATTPGKKTLEFKVKVLETSSTRKFAFAQIHDFKQDIWDDLLRIQIQSDKPFAKPGDTGRIYILGDVTEGELTDGFPKDFRAEYYADRYILNDYVLGEELHVKVEMENSIMKIFLNDMNTPVRTYTGLECKSNYYKVGVYNQSVKADSTGNGVAEFCEIKVSDNF